MNRQISSGSQSGQFNRQISTGSRSGQFNRQISTGSRRSGKLSYKDCPQVEIVSHRKCCTSSEYFVLNQALAVVRHADRLDKTPEWSEHPELHKYFVDTPLTALGHAHAEEAGKALQEQSQKLGLPFSLIVSSPYLRCAQTASRIAQVVGLPVLFDRDLGEVSHMEYWEGGKPPRIRDHAELKAALEVDFPKVEYIKDDSGSLQIRGKELDAPEVIHNARLRFCFKVQQLTRQAANKLSSIIIVTHADSVAAVTSILKPAWDLLTIPYTGYLVASRQVKVFDKKADMALTEEPVFGRGTEWTVELGPGFDCKETINIVDINLKERERMSEKQQELSKAQSSNSLSCLMPPEEELENDLILNGSSEKDAKDLVRCVTRLGSKGFVGEDPTHDPHDRMQGS